MKCLLCAGARRIARGTCHIRSVLHLLQFPPRITVNVLLLGCSTLVMLLLALTEGDLNFDQVASEVDGGRDEGESPLVNLALELLDLSLMGQQPPVPQWLVVVEVPVGVGLNGEPYQGKGGVGDRDIAVGEAELAFPDGLHLCSHQCDTALQILDDLVVEVGLPILLQKLECVLVLFHLIFPGDAKPYEVSTCSSVDSSHRMLVNGGGGIEIAPPLHYHIRGEGEGRI